MKTKDEIEKSARIYENYRSDSSELAQAESGGLYHGYKKGYNDCLKDMADKKYTEDDMRNIFLYGHDKGDSSMVLMDKETSFQDYIESLNKQD